MMTLVSLLIGLAEAATPAFDVEGVARWPADKAHGKVMVGGLSAVTLHRGDLYLLSDDRGKHGSPRFYRASMGTSLPQAGDRRLLVELKEQFFFQGVKEAIRERIVLDPEGMVAWAGRFIISSEADTSRKPRQKNRLLMMSSKGQYQGDISFPVDVQPESVGRHLSGSTNNFGPEGLSITPSGTGLWVAFERPILIAGKPEPHVRFLRYRLNDETWEYQTHYRYEVDEPRSEHREILRGVSEVLALGEETLLVMERSARLGKVGMSFGGGLYRATCSKSSCEKVPVLDFLKDLDKVFPDGEIPNFEGMTFLDEDRRRLLLVSDNNFSSRTETVFLVLRFKENL